MQCTHAQRAPHFFAITLGLLKIKNNSLISRGGEGSQLCLQHNKQTTAVFTSFVLITFCHFFATPSPTLSKIYELYQSGNPKGARWAYLARSGNQSEPRASDCPGYCQRNDLERRLCAHVTKNRLKYRQKVSFEKVHAIATVFNCPIMM